MTLRLSLDNLDRLPDGGPLRVEVKGRGLDIGRDAHLDWTLPDPSRHVSGKHCEIRFRDGEYWLHDVSTNGTFVNGSQFRVEGPRILRTGDKLSIGPYLVSVEVEGRPTAGVAPALREESDGDVWGAVGEAAAPEDRNSFRPKKPPPAPPDFLDFASTLGDMRPASAASAAPSAFDDWLSVPARAPPPVAPAPPPPKVPVAPSPRRPSPRPAAEEAPVSPFADIPEGANERELEPAPRPGPTPPLAPVAPIGPDILARIAVAAGLPESIFAGRDPGAVASEIGLVLRATAGNLAQMLDSRAETKTLMRSSSRTMIRALENNPLKFMGTPEEALAAMFGPRSRNYLDAITTVERSFADLKNHQLLTFAAMQRALEAMFEELAPEKIDSSVEPDRGLGALVSSRKAKLWDIYVERWRAKSKRSDGRLNESFMLLFSEAYDRLNEKS